ncbi:MAG: DUF5693 family protein [Clostridiales bacterium]|nr:DUF5693 family protein [Clostridiales bacterium]MCF8022929.1 DUF5693 family protein [Clostridiales bacterium]
MQKWLTRGLAAIILLALIAAGLNLYNRYNLEQEHRGMEIAAVYNEVEHLSSLASRDANNLLQDFKERGVTTLLFKEDTPGMLEDRGEFIIGTGLEMNDLYDLKEQVPESEFKPGSTYLITEDKKAWERVTENMEDKGISFNSCEISGDKYIINTSLSQASLAEQGLGFPFHLIRQASAYGFNIMVQPRTWHGAAQDQIEAVMENFQDVPRLTGVLFNDNTLPGYVKDKNRKVYLRALGNEIKKLDVPLVDIEFEDQKGFSSVARVLDKQVVRLHTIPRDEMRNYNAAGAVDRYELAATDRNIRVMLVRFFTGTEYPDLIGKNLGLLEKLQNNMQQKGFELGRASTFGSLNISLWSILILGLGAAAGGVFLLLQLFPRRWALVLGALGFAGWILLAGAAAYNPEFLMMPRKLAALGAAIIFPTLAVTWGVRQQGSSVRSALLRFSGVVTISMIGAVLMAALLTGPGFMLKLDQFSGVKAAMGMPLVIAAVYFFSTSSPRENLMQKLASIARKPVTIGTAGVAAVLAVLLGLYMMRTGNAGIVLPFESAFRSFLEETLKARPRTKEFMLGYPLLLLLLYTGCRNIRFLPLVILAAIGQVSMVNTFAHIHTPLVISLLRTFNGLWLGILGGLVLIALWYIFEKYIWKRIYREIE